MRSEVTVDRRSKLFISVRSEVSGDRRSKLFISVRSEVAGDGRNKRFHFCEKWSVSVAGRVNSSFTGSWKYFIAGS